MSFFKKITTKFEDEPVTRATIKTSERIGSRIQKVTLSFPYVEDIFPMGSYIIPMTSGCVPRAYSVAESTHETCTIIVSFSGMGAGARFFAEAPVGTHVDFYGAYSDFPYRYDTERPKIFFATSTGVAPFLRMVTAAVEKEGLEALLVLGSPKEADLAYKEVFYELEKQNPLFHFMPCLSAEGEQWKGRRGYVTDQFKGHEDVLRKSDIYICGIPIMTQGVLNMLKAAHVPEKQIFVQKFG